jgi:hypothetical protein
MQLLPSPHDAVCMPNHATKLSCVHAAAGLMLKLPSPTCCRPFAVHLECQQPDPDKVGHLSQNKQRIMVLDGAPEDQQRLRTTPVKQCTGCDKQLPKSAHTGLLQIQQTDAATTSIQFSCPDTLTTTPARHPRTNFSWEERPFSHRKAVSSGSLTFESLSS